MEETSGNRDSLNEKGIKNWSEQRGMVEEWNEKRIKICYVHAQIIQDKGNQYALQTCTIKTTQ